MRTFALYDNQLVDIRSFLFSEDGSPVQFSEEILLLRMLARRKELLCPCGCGRPVTPIFEEDLAKSYFRTTRSSSKTPCTYSDELEDSLPSLACLQKWMKTKLPNAQVQFIPPAMLLDNCNNIIIRYWQQPSDVTEEAVLECQQQEKNYTILHVLNGNTFGQKGEFPSQKVQLRRRQRYLLYLHADDTPNTIPNLSAAVLMQNYKNIWQELPLVEDRLENLNVNPEGFLFFRHKRLLDLAMDKQSEYRLTNERKRDQAEKQKETLK